MNSLVWLMDPQDAGLADVIASVTPFYKTADFKPVKPA
jgi:hypothetical protein